MKNMIEKAIEIIEELQVYNWYCEDEETEKNIKETFCITNINLFLTDDVSEIEDIERYVFLKNPEMNFNELKELVETIKIIAPVYSARVNSISDESINQAISRIKAMYVELNEVKEVNKTTTLNISEQFERELAAKNVLNKIKNSKKLKGHQEINVRDIVRTYDNSKTGQKEVAIGLEELERRGYLIRFNVGRKKNIWLNPKIMD
ncbi:hypothetical protein JRU67_04450 [Mammaliicoccus sciuri]|uniref:Uncharacterized protein n=1 Tax=Mammaliicoccus sciuri TaxID=1296 RepID=A0AB37HR32_MAMSC|nr:hypothetical protein [Mammaliicoccus sciuri]QRN92063.1 hypothetical protein JRU67_04450 [Mammaliicoccus sciuri]